MADLTRAELRAVYAAAQWGADDTADAVWSRHMRWRAGPRWRVNLRRGMAALSRELAKAGFVKRRK